MFFDRRGRGKSVRVCAGTQSVHDMQVAHIQSERRGVIITVYAALTCRMAKRILMEAQKMGQQKAGFLTVDVSSRKFDADKDSCCKAFFGDVYGSADLPVEYEGIFF